MPLSTPHLTLAQTTLDPKIWVYFAILILLVIIGAILIFALRRQLLSSDEPDSISSRSGLMDHLDHMRKSGEITDEEYESTRRTIIENTLQQLNKPSTSDTDADT